MTSRARNVRALNLHPEIRNAYVATPISDWGTDDVWEYLFENNPPPWGYPHDEMLELYRQAGGGECPVVVDLNTPSCGGSRFGCWTCTVVKLDRSMNGFIRNGETWMQPLADFRTLLKEIREDESRRSDRRRDGRIGKQKGPFNPETRQFLLWELLRTERALADGGRKMVLIMDEEIAYIQGDWTRDFDLANSALEIARSFGRPIGEGVAVELLKREDEELARLCGEFGVNEELIRKVVALESKYPDLAAWGASTDLKRDLDGLIKTAVRQGEQAVAPGLDVP